MSKISGLPLTKIQNEVTTLRGSVEPGFQRRAPFPSGDLSNEYCFDCYTYVDFRVAAKLITNLNARATFVQKLGEEVLNKVRKVKVVPFFFSMCWRPDDGSLSLSIIYRKPHQLIFFPCLPGLKPGLTDHHRDEQTQQCHQNIRRTGRWAGRLVTRIQQHLGIHAECWVCQDVQNQQR